MNTNNEIATKEPCGASRQSYRVPEYRVRSGADAYVAEVSIPGVPKGGVEIGLENEILTVTARRNSAVPEGWKPLVTELETSDYRLRLELNAPIDPQGITAKVEDGMLTLTLPVREAAKPRLVEVS